MRFIHKSLRSPLHRDAYCKAPLDRPLPAGTSDFTLLDPCSPTLPSLQLCTYSRERHGVLCGHPHCISGTHCHARPDPSSHCGGSTKGLCHRIVRGGRTRRSGRSERSLHSWDTTSRSSPQSGFFLLTKGCPLDPPNLSLLNCPSILLFNHYWYYSLPILPIIIKQESRWASIPSHPSHPIHPILSSLTLSLSSYFLKPISLPATLSVHRPPS